MRLRRSLLLLAVAALIWAPAAAAKNYAPPGKAGTSEYAEVIPSGGGNVSTPALGGTVDKTSAQISKLGAGTTGVSKLAKLGKTGAAAAQFAQETAPTVAVPSAVLTRHRTDTGTKAVVVKAAGHATHRAATVLVTAAGGSALSGVGHLLGGSDQGGIGLFLPLLLGVMLALAVGYVIGRRVSATRNA